MNIICLLLQLRKDESAGILSDMRFILRIDSNGDVFNVAFLNTFGLPYVRGILDKVFLDNLLVFHTPQVSLCDVSLYELMNYSELFKLYVKPHCFRLICILQNI